MQDRERDAVSLDHKMALRALFAAIRRVLARFLAPRSAPRRSPVRPGSVDATGLGQLFEKRLV
jgi:hypothetical protein